MAASATVIGMDGDAPVRLLRGLPLQTRVVVRTRIEGGYTDALGYLTDIGAERCIVRTRRGPVEVAFADVVLAKQVPEPPPRRRPRFPLPGADR